MDKRTHLYNTRGLRLNPGSPSAREESSHTHGTSPLLSSRRLQHGILNDSDEENSESNDSESSDSEPNEEVVKKLNHKANLRLSDKSTKENTSTQPYGFTTSKGANVEPHGFKGKNVEPYGFKGANVEPYGFKGTNVEPYGFKGANVEPRGFKGTNVEPCRFTTSKGTNVIVISSIVVLLVAAAATYYSLYSSYLSLQERKSQLQEAFREIRKQFPTQEDNLWLTLFSGIKKVEEDPLQPSTFLLLHEVEDDETLKCLAVKMSKAATAFLEATDPSPLKLQGEELGANDSIIKDHGILISEQKENITNHRAVIIFNLHKIPASVAQCFHYFCDEYNPVVQKAVYFFTMSIGKKLQSSPTHIAELELKKLWQQQLETDKLQPLIVRLTTSVVVIKPEKGLASTCD